MEDIKALTECAECTWDYIDRLRMSLASACKERDELKKELQEAKSELEKYHEAEQDGRLVVLPCKVGDTVYRVLTTRDCPPVISEVKIKTVGQAADLIGKMGKRKLLSYYLTREEAEAALALKGGEG